jgi:hypothetical protein
VLTYYVATDLLSRVDDEEMWGATQTALDEVVERPSAFRCRRGRQSRPSSEIAVEPHPHDGPVEMKLHDRLVPTSSRSDVERDGEKERRREPRCYRARQKNVTQG